MNKMITMATIALTALSMSAQSQVLTERPVNQKASTMLVDQVSQGYFIVKFKDNMVHESLMQSPETNTLLSTMAKSKSASSKSYNMKAKYNVESNMGREYGEGVLNSLSQEIVHVRSLALSNDLIKVSTKDKTADQIMIELLNSGRFEYVEPKRIYQAFNFEASEYNDTFYSSQRYFADWSNDISEGSGYAKLRSNTVNNLGRKVRIAVIDSGSYAHEDVDFVAGYDFVTFEGFDENGEEINKERDSDPTDEFINEAGVICNSGHGLSVSSIIAAKANNGLGMVGAVDSESVEIVPVRSLGCQGGSNIDILESALWSAGENIPGVPDIETPVDIINMSLGGLTTGGCPEYEQEVFDRLKELGVTVVVAAGNENIDVNNILPAACSDLITVGSTTLNGDKANFSNFGDKVDLSTIGVSTIIANLSTTSESEYASGQGTSFSTPLVAATVASMKLKYPSLTPENIEAILKSNVVDNSLNNSGTKTICGRLGCGTGILEAQDVIVAIDNASTITKYEVAHRYEGYESDADKAWLTEMSTYVNACGLIKYTWGGLGVELSGVTYKLHLSENSGEMVELETVTIPQKVYNLPDNSVIGVQACSGSDCGDIVSMSASGISKPAACI
jgi:serine protease